MLERTKKIHINYRTYLRSDAWKARRLKHLARHPLCFACNGNSQLQVHHKTYARLGSEAPRDLATLCDACHELAHNTGCKIASKRRLHIIAYNFRARERGAQSINLEHERRF